MFFSSLINCAFLIKCLSRFLFDLIFDFTLGEFPFPRPKFFSVSLAAFSIDFAGFSNRSDGMICAYMHDLQAPGSNYQIVKNTILDYDHLNSHDQNLLYNLAEIVDLKFNSLFFLPLLYGIHTPANKFGLSKSQERTSSFLLINQHLPPNGLP
ncbi:hypothetical protein BpHYR1_003740 [Brachionus plicatilis]|uniref:Uncharacterized protein n=1 Tax=Brachionus plicatilis TaxID=10195 RepID=A0A3M7QTM1_BRAPC|nr:hypothetical protein BpHYR1_003740 [Brachionus plicatilis]